MDIVGDCVSVNDAVKDTEIVGDTDPVMVPLGETVPDTDTFVVPDTVRDTVVVKLWVTDMDSVGECVFDSDIVNEADVVEDVENEREGVNVAVVETETVELNEPDGLVDSERVVAGVSVDEMEDDSHLDTVGVTDAVEETEELRLALDDDD